MSQIWRNWAEREGLSGDVGTKSETKTKQGNIKQMKNLELEMDEEDNNNY